MPTSTLDLSTITAAKEAVVAAMRNAVCQWEQQSQDAAYDGNLTAALMYQNWAFAANLMATTAGTTLTRLLMEAYDQKCPEFSISVPVEAEDLEPLPV